MKALVLTFVLLGAAPCLQAADEPLQFDDPVKQERYQQLLHELRCLVCQNQSLADSHADLAQDLREEVFEMVEAGQPNEGIVDFLVERYGEFVLYRPPVNWTTVLLWFGPFLLLLGALVGVYRFVRARQSGEVVLSAADHERAARLLDERPGD